MHPRHSILWLTGEGVRTKGHRRALHKLLGSFNCWALCDQPAARRIMWPGRHGVFCRVTHTHTHTHTHRERERERERGEVGKRKKRQLLKCARMYVCCTGIRAQDLNMLMMDGVRGKIGSVYYYYYCLIMHEKKSFMIDQMSLDW